MSYGKHCFVVDLQQVIRRGNNRRVELSCGYLRAIPLRTTRLDIDRAKQSQINLAAVTFAAGRRAHRVDHVNALLAGVPGVDN